VPIEAAFNADFDLKAPTPEEQKQLDEEKKSDLENHATMSEAFEEVKNNIMPTDDIMEKRERLCKMIECLPIESSFREDLIFYLKRIVISWFCLKYNFKKALLGTTSQKVATALLAAICKGRGASVSNEIAYIDDKNFGGRVQFMNPMRDFLIKEIGLYNHNRKVSIIFQGSLAKQNQEKATRKTTSEFFGSTDLVIDGFFSRL